MLALFAQTTTSFCKKIDHNIDLWGKHKLFWRKMAKTAENCDYNFYETVSNENHGKHYKGDIYVYEC
jgi:hypothetical protein